MALSLQTDQKVDLTVAALDADGNPVALKDVPSWSLTDSAVLTVLAYNDDFTVATVASADGAVDGAVASVNVTVNGVASAPFDIAVVVPVVEPVTATVTITAGDPVPR
jgi:hypothetical protein